MNRKNIIAAIAAFSVMLCCLTSGCSLPDKIIADTKEGSALSDNNKTSEDEQNNADTQLQTERIDEQSEVSEIPEKSEISEISQISVVAESSDVSEESYEPAEPSEEYEPEEPAESSEAPEAAESSGSLRQEEFAQPSETAQIYEPSEPEVSEEQHSQSVGSNTESSEEHVHSFGDWKTVVEATCTESGLEERYCSCGEKISRKTGALGHNYKKSSEKTENGVKFTVYRCKRCKDSYTDEEPVKKKDKNSGKITPVNEWPVTESSGDESAVSRNKTKPISISELDITVENIHVFDGKMFRPEVVVKYKGRKLTKDFRVTYDPGAIGPGNYTLTVRMDGRFTGSREYEYFIFPKSTKLKAKKSDDRILFSWDKCVNVDGFELEIARKKDFSDAESIDFGKNKLSYSMRRKNEKATIYARVRSYKFTDKEDKTRSCSYWSNTDNVVVHEITVKDGVTYLDGVLIANKTYSLPESYGYDLLPETKSAFNKMVKAAAKEGLTLFVASGFRSYSTQSSTYSYYVSVYGAEQADRFSARPGHSEHQTGMAIDVNSPSDAFVGTPEAAWLAKHCWEYGFIVRYPEGKEDITGYKFEPWHIRYLGKDWAKKIYDSGLTLEEYFDIDSEYKD